MAARTAVVAGTATAVSGRVQRRQQGRWAAKEEQQAAEQAPPEPQYAEPQYAEPPAAPSTDDKLAQLKQLGELRDHQDRVEPCAGRRSQAADAPNVVR